MSVFSIETSKSISSFIPCSLPIRNTNQNDVVCKMLFRSHTDCWFIFHCLRIFTTTNLSWLFHVCRCTTWAMCLRALVHADFWCFAHMHTEQNTNSLHMSSNPRKQIDTWKTTNSFLPFLVVVAFGYFATEKWIASISIRLWITVSRRDDNDGCHWRKNHGRTTATTKSEKPFVQMWKIHGDDLAASHCKSFKQQ